MQHTREWSVKQACRDATLLTARSTSTTRHSRLFPRRIHSVLESQNTAVDSGDHHGRVVSVAVCVALHEKRLDCLPT